MTITLRELVLAGWTGLTHSIKNWFMMQCMNYFSDTRIATCLGFWFTVLVIMTWSLMFVHDIQECSSLRKSIARCSLGTVFMREEYGKRRLVCMKYSDGTASAPPYILIHNSTEWWITLNDVSTKARYNTGRITDMKHSSQMETGRQCVSRKVIIRSKSHKTTSDFIKKLWKNWAWGKDYSKNDTSILVKRQLRDRGGKIIQTM